MNVATPHTVQRWRWEDGELRHIGTYLAPQPRAGAQEDAHVDRELDDNPPPSREAEGS